MPVANEEIKTKTKIDEDDIEPAEYDENGNLKGPFDILRKKQITKFSTRQDVVNKTLIRSLKKYYTQKFKQIAKKYILEGVSQHNQSQLVDRFVNEYIYLKNKSNKDDVGDTLNI